MQSLPVVGAELAAVSTGFRGAAHELAAARRVVAGLGTGLVGTRACDGAVEAGLRDLAAVLDRLEATASACVQVLGRYDGGDDAEASGDRREAVPDEVVAPEVGPR